LVKGKETRRRDRSREKRGSEKDKKREERRREEEASQKRVGKREDGGQVGEEKEERQIKRKRSTEHLSYASGSITDWQRSKLFLVSGTSLKELLIDVLIRNQQKPRQCDTSKAQLPWKAWLS
jgi:type IV secretory pathway VirB10-like protein